MASIIDDGGGRKRIQFVAGDGKRRAVRLGKCSERNAEPVARHIEALNAAKIHGNPPPRETAAWLDSIGAKLHRKLARVGLVESREPVGAVKLGAFIDEYLAQRGDVKPGTMIVFRQSQRWLVRFMGEDKPVTAVTPADADAYRAYLLASNRNRERKDGEQTKRSKATVAKWCQYARHYFQVAVRRRLIAENPFAHIRGSVHGNAARRVFVKAADVEKVIAVCPDPQWKLLLALARYGGLRIPSEALALRWGDIDWSGNRFTVRASKTEHHDGGGVRVVPLFPELLPHLQAVFEAAPEGSEYIITRYRDTTQNLRTQFMRYITAAGLKPWPKPWQNMRATRATELADVFPSHVCAAWLGHTEAVADEFYRQVTDEHFAKAVTPQENDNGKAAHFPAQQPHADARNASRPVQETAFCDEKRAIAIHGDTSLGAPGFEPGTKSL